MAALKAALAAVLATGLTSVLGIHGAKAASCSNSNALGVARTVQIDTTGGPGFGFEHYKANDFLQSKEVVLTFDDGPQKFSTEMVLAALAEQCTKATFFSIGKMALGYPEIIREVVKGGHTVGTHTWSHKPIRKLKTFEEGRDEIERGVSAVKRAVGGPIAPFFRFPTLVDTPESLQHLAKRNIAMFSTDIDSFDFKLQPPEALVKGVMTKLDKQGKGIILMHDIHKNTAKALPLLLAALKNGGYKVVHLTAKDAVTSLAEYDAAIDKEAKGLPQAGSERPVSSIVKTIDGDVPEAEKAPAANASPAPSAPAAAQPPAPKVETPAPQAPRAEAAPEPKTPSQESIKAEPAVEPPTESYKPAHIQSAEATVPAATGSVTSDSHALSSEPPAEGVAAPAHKSWSSKAVEIWNMWFGK